MSVLVAADATVMSAQDNLASEAQSTHLESREALLERSSSGLASLQVLARVQGYLASNPADCANLTEYLAMISATGVVSGDDSGISFAANATAVYAPSSQPAPADNLTVAAPFSGYLPGALNLHTLLSVREVGGGGAVTLEKRESHTLNLPIAPDSASSLCASALGSLADALSRSPCNSTLEQEAFDALLPGLVEAATAQGFDLTAGWGSGGSACSATYWVTLVEPGVAGAAGRFDWTVRGSGTTA